MSGRLIPFGRMLEFYEMVQPLAKGRFDRMESVLGGLFIVYMALHPVSDTDPDAFVRSALAWVDAELKRMCPDVLEYVGHVQ